MAPADVAELATRAVAALRALGAQGRLSCEAFGALVIA